MAGLEFEQKFVLDPRKFNQIFGVLLDHEFTEPVTHIRQYYDKGGDRFRETIINDRKRHIKEVKKSVKIGTPYSICSEHEIEISAEDFEAGWEKNAKRRLQKDRIQVEGKHPDHIVIVDFFFTKSDVQKEERVYAIIAEDETILGPTTSNLYLSFELPIYLESYCLMKVDDSDPDMKVFKSANMVDTPTHIEAVKRAISRLYGPL